LPAAAAELLTAEEHGGRHSGNADRLLRIHDRHPQGHSALYPQAIAGPRSVKRPTGWEVTRPDGSACHK